jgi:hypothetical protein
MRQLAAIPGIAGAPLMPPLSFAEIPAVIAGSGVAGKKTA